MSPEANPSPVPLLLWPLLELTPPLPAVSPSPCPGTGRAYGALKVAAVPEEVWGEGGREK